VTIGYLDPVPAASSLWQWSVGFAAAGVAVRQARHRFTSKFSHKQAEADAMVETTDPDAGPATTEV
jgi:hypothetical protein